MTGQSEEGHQLGGAGQEPPSTGRVTPVIQDASSEARNATAAAMSLGSPTRPSG